MDAERQFGLAQIAMIEARRQTNIAIAELSRVEEEWYDDCDMQYRMGRAIGQLTIIGQMLGHVDV